MRFTLLTITLTFWAFQAKGQTLANSLFVEYGYPNIQKDSTTIQTMFGYSKYRVYADDKFVKVEVFQDLPEEMTMECVMVEKPANTTTLF